MNKSSSLPSLEELLIESVDRRGHKMKVGIPHPLIRFGLNGSFQDNEYADAVADFIVDTVGAEPDTRNIKRLSGFFWRVSKPSSVFVARRESTQRN